MRLHRIALAEFSATAADAFGGRGGLFGKGRWHSQGRLIVYASEHASLAMAEALVHLQRSRDLAPFNRWEIDLPDAVVASPPELPDDWAKRFDVTRSVGDAWLAAAATVAMRVPSAVVSGEFNALVNPVHRDFDLKWVVAGPILFRFDSRLTG